MVFLISKEFKYAGEAKDFGGTNAYHYEGIYWIIGVWTEFLPNHYLLQGSLENMAGDIFHFTLHDGFYLTYNRVLVSMYDGLGKCYDETDKVVPKYVVDKVKSIAEQVLLDGD